jgi:hypothetical protein
MNNSSFDNKDFALDLDVQNPKLQSAASCRACGTHITFKKLQTGHSIPLEDDSNIHRCAEWKTWRADDG